MGKLAKEMLDKYKARIKLEAEPPQQRTKPGPPLRTEYIQIEVDVRVDFYPEDASGQHILELDKTHYKAYGWEHEEKSELIMNIQQMNKG